MTRLTGQAVRELDFQQVTSGSRYDIDAVERLRARIAVTLETWTLRRDAVQKGRSTPPATAALLSSDAVSCSSLPPATGDDAGYACADVDRFVREAAEAITRATRSFHTEAVVASRLGATTMDDKVRPGEPDEPAGELSPTWPGSRTLIRPDLPATAPRQEDANSTRMALATAFVTLVVLLGILMAPGGGAGSAWPEGTGGSGRSDVVERSVRDKGHAAVSAQSADAWSSGGRVGSRQELMGVVTPSSAPVTGR